MDLKIHPQKGHDLGERMKQSFITMFQLGYDSCVIIGSDIPDLPVSVLYDAFERLKTAETVIGPATDGGYYLIGFQRFHLCNSVFQNIDWSTDRVFHQTLNILEQKGLRVHILRKWWDIDDIKELKDFRDRNLFGEFRNSRTMKFLKKHKRDIFNEKNDNLYSCRH
jgi:rSAM/selenodomain-associated transferase 1